MTDRPSLRVSTLATGQLDFSLQTAMYNPNAFPTNPQQGSERLRVTVFPSYLIQGDLFDTRNGIHQNLATFTDPAGDLFMTVPFAIDGHVMRAGRSAP